MWRGALGAGGGARVPSGVAPDGVLAGGRAGQHGRLGEESVEEQWLCRIVSSPHAGGVSFGTNAPCAASASKKIAWGGVGKSRVVDFLKRSLISLL